MTDSPVPADCQTIIDIRFDFLNGTYHGMEWPPSSARMFGALVAGAKYRYRNSWKHEFDDALEWLEEQRPPLILAPEKRQLKPYRMAVPSNDLDVYYKNRIQSLKKGNLKNVDTLGNHKTIKEMSPFLVNDAIHYIYSVNCDAPIKILEEIVNSVSSLGHGIDLVSGRVIKLEGITRNLVSDGVMWAPDEETNKDGVALPSPSDGYYNKLKEKYDERTKWAESIRYTKSAQPLTTFYYRKGEDGLYKYAIFILRAPDGSKFSYPWEGAATISAMVRHLLIEKAGPDHTKAQYVSGHIQGKEKGDWPCYVPLPSIGNRYADGYIRRVLIAFPRNSAYWNEMDITNLYGELKHDGNVVAKLEKISSDDGVSKLYTGSSKIWRSVFPVILHGHDKQGSTPKLHKISKLVAEAFSEAGYLTPIESFRFTKVPLWPGTKAAQDCKPPSNLSSWPRYHIEVIFRKEVTGPVMVGLGRHRGIGVFASLKPRT